MPIGNRAMRCFGVSACALILAPAAMAADAPGSGAAPARRAESPASPAPSAVIVRDAKTGLLRPATPQEIQAVASEVDRLLARGTAPQTAVKLPDGATAYKMTGNLANGAVARRNPDGKIEISCFDEPDAAKRFMGLVPGAPPVPSKTSEER